jgi:hypothetical protein
LAHKFKVTTAIALLAGLGWGRKLPDQKLPPPCSDVHIISLDLGIFRLQGNVVSTSETPHRGFDLYVSFEDKNGPVRLANDVRVKLGELPPMQGVPFWVDKRATACQIRAMAALRLVNFFTDFSSSKGATPAKLFQVSTKRDAGHSEVSLASSFAVENDCDWSAPAGRPASAVMLLSESIVNVAM